MGLWSLGDQGRQRKRDDDPGAKRRDAKDRLFSAERIQRSKGRGSLQENQTKNPSQPNAKLMMTSRDTGKRGLSRGKAEPIKQHRTWTLHYQLADEDYMFPMTYKGAEEGKMKENERTLAAQGVVAGFPNSNRIPRSTLGKHESGSNVSSRRKRLLRGGKEKKRRASRRCRFEKVRKKTTAKA